MVLFASMVINIGCRGQDGRSAWELCYGHKCGRQMPEFSEQILWRDGSKKSRLDDRWHKGLYLGPCLRTSDSLVGVVKARTFRRLPESQKGAAEIVKGLRGVPWRPDGALEE
eukprot:6013359-Amphidinium_carterae.1